MEHYYMYRPNLAQTFTGEAILKTLIQGLNAKNCQLLHTRSKNQLQFRNLCDQGNNFENNLVLMVGYLSWCYFYKSHILPKSKTSI